MPSEYKPPKMCLRTSISPVLIFRILRYMIQLTIISFQLTILWKYYLWNHCARSQPIQGKYNIFCIAGNPTWGHETTKAYPLNQWIHVEVKQYWSEQERVYYRANTINDEVGKVQNTVPKIYKNVNVYIGAGDPRGSDPQEGKIKNIQIYPGASGSFEYTPIRGNCIGIKVDLPSFN